jgi:hypothetical protein
MGGTNRNSQKGIVRMAPTGIYSFLQIDLLYLGRQYKLRYHAF